MFPVARKVPLSITVNRLLDEPMFPIRPSPLTTASSGVPNAPSGPGPKPAEKVELEIGPPLGADSLWARSVYRMSSLAQN